MTSRFSFGPPAPHDAEIVERATELKIHLWRQSTGKLHGDVTIRCGIGMFAADDDDADYDLDAAEQRQAEALEFASRMLCEFQKHRPTEGDLC